MYQKRSKIRVIQVKALIGNMVSAEFEKKFKKPLVVIQSAKICQFAFFF